MRAPDVSPLTKLVAMTICQASLHPGQECPFCAENGGRCSHKFWRLFVREADAVLAELRARGYLSGGRQSAQSVLLPGLGGGPVR